MNPLSIELTRLIGKKELTFGCLFLLPGDMDGHILIDEDHSMLPNGIIYTPTVEKEKKIIGNPATLSDFHRWMNDIKDSVWTQTEKRLCFMIDDGYGRLDCDIPYDSSKDLLDQEESILKQIVSLIKES